MDEAASKILLVDDSPGDIRILANLLAGMATLVFATSGEDALVKAGAEDFDVILLDVMLPDMDGFEVCRQLNRAQTEAPAPVIFVTALDDVASEEKGLLLGAMDYVSKPFVPAVVRARVSNHLLLSRTAKALRRANRQLELLAALDPLTDVFNRRHFDAAFQQELMRAQRTGKPLSLLLLDLDHFKAINDTHGHAAGDAALVQAAKAWQAELRAHDVIARAGGEEFAIVLPGADARQARVVAERLLDVTRRLRIALPEGGSFGFTTSVGVAAGCGCDPRVGYEQVMASADRALYAAKREGRDRAAFGPEGCLE
ncbi:MAG: diguanylate cyclase [Alphaproteobacteria bacterium]|nr:diguanylate cyclase [Alphaproteobacteria bacterium]